MTDPHPVSELTSDLIVTSTSYPGSVRHTDGAPSSTTIQNKPRIVAEPDVDHPTGTRPIRHVQLRVHPPNEQLGVELLRLWFAEHPTRAPLAESEHDRFE
jgi:hypothetical protein